MKKDYATLMAETICKVNWLVENAERQNEVLKRLVKDAGGKTAMLRELLEKADKGKDSGDDAEDDGNPVLS